MSWPWVIGPNRSGPSGYTYAAVAVRLHADPSGGTRTGSDLLAAFREIRFNGWVAPAEQGWVLAVATPAAGSVATGRRGVLGVGEWLAQRLGATVVAVRVVEDRQLLLAMWADGDELGRYVSDPSYGLDRDDVLSDPLGVEHAEAFAAAVGRPQVTDELAELLAEDFDPDSVIESERLAGVLRLLGLPGWLVAAASLPRDMPGGPPVRDLTRLGAGLPGLRGRVLGRLAQTARRRRQPPPAVPDPPRADPGIDPWLF
jgi:hypothetical protein